MPTLLQMIYGARGLDEAKSYHQYTWKDVNRALEDDRAVADDQKKISPKERGEALVYFAKWGDLNGVTTILKDNSTISGPHQIPVTYRIAAAKATLDYIKQEFNKRPTIFNTIIAQESNADIKEKIPAAESSALLDRLIERKKQYLDAKASYPYNQNLDADDFHSSMKALFKHVAPFPVSAEVGENIILNAPNDIDLIHAVLQNRLDHYHSIPDMDADEKGKIYLALLPHHAASAGKMLEYDRACYTHADAQPISVTDRKAAITMAVEGHIYNYGYYGAIENAMKHEKILADKKQNDARIELIDAPFLDQAALKESSKGKDLSIIGRLLSPSPDKQTLKKIVMNITRAIDDNMHIGLKDGINTIKDLGKIVTACVNANPPGTYDETAKMFNDYHRQKLAITDVPVVAQEKSWVAGHAQPRAASPARGVTMVD